MAFTNQEEEGSGAAGFRRPQAFREYKIAPADAKRVANDAVDAARALYKRGVGCDAWAVHLSHDRRRIVTVEAWRDDASFHQAGRYGVPTGFVPEIALYERVGTSGIDPTPVGDASLGVTVIDLFRIWRPLAHPVSLFNLRNGEAFTRQPGCVSTTVLRGRSTGRIATYARWSTTDDFLAAFTATQGTPVDSTDALDAAAARMTRGLVRTDYHSYDLLDAQKDGLR